MSRSMFSSTCDLKWLRWKMTLNFSCFLLHFHRKLEMGTTCNASTQDTWKLPLPVLEQIIASEGKAQNGLCYYCLCSSFIQTCTCIKNGVFFMMCSRFQSTWINTWYAVHVRILAHFNSISGICPAILVVFCACTYPFLPIKWTPTHLLNQTWTAVSKGVVLLLSQSSKLYRIITNVHRF